MARIKEVKVGDEVMVWWKDITEQLTGWRPKGEHLEPIEARSMGIVSKVPDGENDYFEIIGDEQVDGDFEGRAQVKLRGVVQRIEIYVRSVPGKLPDL